MSVFDAKVKIGRDVSDPDTDHSLPPSGALSYGSIKSTSALAGTNGVDTLLVNGNRDRQMNGNESTRVTQNRLHRIGGNQNKQVAGNRVDTVAGNHMHTIMGDTHRAIIGNTNDSYTGGHTVEHKEEQKVQETTTFMHDIKEFLEKHQWHAEDYAYAWYFAYVVLNVIGSNTELRGAHTEAKLGKVEGFIVGLAAGVHETGLGACKEEAHVVHNHINVVQPVVAVAMLHEVVITQKILIVGVNQVI